MIQVLEYIMNNYTWFLCGAILILLAIIGYYADKTNFGQGKNKKDSDDKINAVSESNNEIQLDNNINELTKQDDSIIIEDSKKEVYNEPKDNVELNQTNYNIENNVQTNEVESNNKFGTSIVTDEQSIVSKENIQNTPNETQSSETYDINNNKKQFSSIADEINSITALPEQYLESNVEQILKAEEEFNKFDEEFNLFLPKKEVINTDLLSDIEELDFDKNKKTDLSGVPDLDNISLPKIKNLVADEQDIWKF